MSLRDFIAGEIQHNGPMSVARFMELAIAHYYDSRDPFGAGGDFTTAPEISQMFGEMIGAWAADCWMRMGSPAPFALVECGPGRGTLMADMLRATRMVPGFHEAAQIHLVEQSTVLKDKQREALRGFHVTWHGRLDDVPGGMPLLLVANEFLDALPVRQFQFKDGSWFERVVGLDDEGGLVFGLADTAEIPGHPDPLSFFADKAHAVAEGEAAILEVSPARQDFVRTVCDRLKKQGGVALFIDYGYTQGGGDTLQAVRGHRYYGVLEEPGEADLTAHVDFATLAAVEGVTVHGPVTQGAFLQRLGISQRAAMLRQKANARQGGDIDEALTRLVGAKEMGELFKVIAYSSGDLMPEGFV